MKELLNCTQNTFFIDTNGIAVANMRLKLVFQNRFHFIIKRCFRHSRRFAPIQMPFGSLIKIYLKVNIQRRNVWRYYWRKKKGSRKHREWFVYVRHQAREQSGRIKIGFRLELHAPQVLLKNMRYALHRHWFIANDSSMQKEQPNSTQNYRRFTSIAFISESSLPRTPLRFTHFVSLSVALYFESLESSEWNIFKMTLTLYEIRLYHTECLLSLSLDTFPGRMHKQSSNSL